MPHVSTTLRLVRSLLAPCLLAAFVLIPATARSADEPAKPAALPADLAAVPTDAVAFAHFHVADLWKSDALADLRFLADKAGPGVLQQFRQRYAPDPATIDRVTLVLQSPKQFVEGGFPSVDPEAVSALVIVTTTQPYDRLRLLESLGSREKVYRRTLYYFNEDLWSGLLPLDDRTFLIASEDALIQFLDQTREPKKDGGLLPALRAAATNQIVYGLNPKMLANEPQFQFVPGNLKPLLDADCITFALNLDKEIRFDVRSDYAKEADAQEGEKAFRAALEMMRQGVGMGITEVEKHLKETEEKPGAGHVAASASMILTLGMLRTVDDELKAAPLARKGTAVLLPLRYRKQDSAALLVASTAAVSAIGQTQNRVFRNIARAIAGGNAPEHNPREEKLKKIAAALEQYHQVKGAYPPAAIRDRDGRPTLSWRVALLPYLGEEELYKEFRPEEPWDSLHNKRLLKRLPEVFKTDDFDGNMRFPGDGFGGGERWRTQIRVIAGPGTVFDGVAGVKKTDVAATTILLALAEDKGPYWTKPADLRYAADQPARGLFPKQGEPIHVLLVDGTFKTLDRATEEKVLRSMITRKP
jgi:hypothetical protein